jgi:hypothetical protein
MLVWYFEFLLKFGSVRAKPIYIVLGHRRYRIKTSVFSVTSNALESRKVFTEKASIRRHIHICRRVAAVGLEVAVEAVIVATRGVDLIEKNTLLRFVNAVGAGQIESRNRNSSENHVEGIGVDVSYGGAVGIANYSNIVVPRC